MTQLIHCIYASTAEPGFTESDIPALLANARTANSANGITGMLLYIEGCFFQILEGEESVVDKVFRRISGDSRHSRITLIIREPISKRSFSDWTMGCSKVDASEAGQLIGENDFFRSSECVTQIGSGRAKKLLAAFAGGSWQQHRTGTHRAVGRRHVRLR
jgi:Sensors of blue-light using FAD